MTTFIKPVIMLGLWLLYALLAWNFCLDGCCAFGDQANSAAIVSDADAADATAETATRRYPVDFQWSNAVPNTNEGFETLQQTITSGMTTDNILDITGYYYEEEFTPEGFDNMGFARAEQVRSLLGLDIPEDRISMHARLLSETDEVRTGYFEGFEYEWIEPEATAAETVEELNDRIIIRFPFGSIEKEYSPEVDEYLDRLATRVQQTRERIRLTGHTDNVGQPQSNTELGQARADQIKRILVDKGIEAGLISTDTKGETQPVASNNTEEGRYENRRVEVRLIKNN